MQRGEGYIKIYKEIERIFLGTCLKFRSVKLIFPKAFSLERDTHTHTHSHTHTHTLLV